MTTDRTIIELPLDQLHDSPFNPPDRATLRIDEMAATIRSAGGILQALLVRPRPGDDQGGYEVVFGHRRKYGGVAAGLATAPCEVRALTDAEARELQAIENVQRENLQALEEATQYRGMVYGGKSANDVAVAIGKSRSHVYGRLRLLDLHPQVLEALQTGEVKSEVAVLITRVGGHKMQAKALQVIRAHNGDIEDGGAKSYRRIRELLNEKFTLALDKAIFPIADADLVPSAGSCLECAKRTGNAPEFEDVTEALTAADMARDEEAIDAEQDEDTAERMYYSAFRARRDHYVPHGGPNVCTDPDCFEAKKTAHLKAEAKRMEREGETVIAGGKARQAINARGELGEGFLALGRLELSTAAKVKPVTIQNPRDGTTVQAYRVEDLKAAGVKVKASKAKKPAGHDPQAYAREQRRVEAEAKLEEQARRAILAAVREQAGAAERSEFDLRLVVRAAMDRLDHPDQQLLLELHAHRNIGALRNAIDTMSAHACGCLLLDCALIANVSGGYWVMPHKPEALLAAAGHYGVDTDAVRQAVQASATTPGGAAEAAAPAPHGAKPKGGSKKSRPAEAQREMLEEAQ